jgi:hypothetical protein
MNRHLMTPPQRDERPQRGLMAPDPTLAAEAPDLRTVLWCVAGVVAFAELVLKALAG